MAIHIQNIFISAVFKKDCVCRLTTLYDQYMAYNTKESMLWNYKTFHFSPKMRQMMYPDCKTTLKQVNRSLTIQITCKLVAEIASTWTVSGPAPGAEKV